jgi:hypothetical protein
MYFIGLDVHKKTISYCVKDAAGRVHQEGKIGSTRRELDGWIRTVPQPRTIAIAAESNGALALCDSGVLAAALASPKSISLAPLFVSMMFPGLRSR